MELEFVKVTSFNHLKEICSDDTPHEFRMLLNGGCYSRKIITHSPEMKQQWEIENCIDESTQYFSEKEFTEKKLNKVSNIPKAIKVGAFFEEVYK